MAGVKGVIGVTSNLGIRIHTEKEQTDTHTHTHDGWIVEHNIQEVELRWLWRFTNNTHTTYDGNMVFSLSNRKQRVRR